MLDQLRGRNLAHVGCTIGLLAGLLLGLIGALVVIQVMQNQNAVNIATVVWLGVTVAARRPRLLPRRLCLAPLVGEKNTNDS